MKVIFNPRCTKCRILRKELDEQEVSWERVLYLEGVLDRALVEEIFNSYAGNWHDLIRTNEKDFKALAIKLKEITKAEAVTLVLNNPVFLQRPIVLKDGNAAITRDNEAIASMLNN